MSTSELMMDSWQSYEWALENVSVIYAYGPPGCGKTYLSYHHALAEDTELFALTLGEEASSVELRGHFLPKGNEAVWHNGPMSQALRAPKSRMVINEVTNASPDVLGMLYPILEDPSTSKFTLPTGETLQAKKGFQIVLTDNYAPNRLPAALNHEAQGRAILVWQQLTI